MPFLPSPPSSCQALRDKDEAVAALRARLAIAAERSSASPVATGSSKEGIDYNGGGKFKSSTAQELAAENTALTAANAQLSLRTRELEGQVARQKEELISIRKIMLELQARGVAGVLLYDPSRITALVVSRCQNLDLHFHTP
jgi:hypothetical protein